MIKKKIYNYLFQTNSHYGHLLKNSISRNFPYLYGSRNSRCIINLELTVITLKKVFLLIKKLLKKNKTILFIVNDYQIRDFNNFFKLKMKNNEKINPNIKLINQNDPALCSSLNKFHLIILFNITHNLKFVNTIKRLKTPTIGFIDTNYDNLSLNYTVMVNENNTKTLFLLNYFFKKFYE